MEQLLEEQIPAKKSGKKSILWKLLLAACVVIVGVLAILRVMKRDDSVVTKPLSTVSVEYPQVEDIMIETSLIGTVMPGDVYYVIPKIAGEIAEIFVSQGDEVQEGDPICRIDNQKQIDSAKLQLDSANLQLKNVQESVNLARTNLDRMKTLFASGDISAQALEQTQNGYDQAVAGLEGAKLSVEGAQMAYDTQIEFSTVTAPVSGRVESTNMSINGIASQQSQLCVITANSGNKIQFNVTDRLLPSLSVGQDIRVEKQGMTYEGSITKVETLPGMQTGMYLVEAQAKGADAIAQGANVKVYFVSEQSPAALTVDTDSIYYDGGATYVYTLSYKDTAELTGDNMRDGEQLMISEENLAGTVHKNPVEIGLQTFGRTEILSGLEEDSVVICSWTSQLYEGAEVQVLKTED